VGPWVPAPHGVDDHECWLEGRLVGRGRGYSVFPGEWRLGFVMCAGNPADDCWISSKGLRKDWVWLQNHEKKIDNLYTSLDLKTLDEWKSKRRAKRIRNRIEMKSPID